MALILKDCLIFNIMALILSLPILLYLFLFEAPRTNKRFDPDILVSITVKQYMFETN